MNQIELKALAKINLGLDVLGRRENGYHDVRMVMQTIYLYDEVKLTKKKEPGIELTTNLGFLPTGDTNIAYKAAKLLIEEFGISEGVKIVLNKHIPVAAGLAGGSSDAAAVLFGMNRMFGLHLQQKDLMERGVKLGADVPYCIMRGTVLAEGIGEELSVLPAMPKCTVLIAKPSVSVSTKVVYEALDSEKIIEHPDIDARGSEAEGSSQDFRKYGERAGGCYDPDASGDRRIEAGHEREWCDWCDDEWQWSYCFRTF